MLSIFPLLALVPLLVALAVVALAYSSKKLGYLAAAASLASLVLLYFVKYGTYTITWFNVGNVPVQITASIAPINIALLAIIFSVGALIYVYSVGFMETLSEQRRFYAEMIAFEVAMAAFAMSGNFILLFLAWEFLSLLSYMLIGFWHSRDKAVRAARIAITTVLIGDIALLAAIVIFWNAFGTFEFSAITSAMTSHVSAEVYAAAALLLLAVFTKSAQFPFQEWLPEAMEGPTPVSAFLHSTTMVKAGVFVAIVLFPIFSAARLLNVMLIFGIITAVIATLDAMREKQIKRVIAYSTVQELSLMLVAIGSGAVVAAIYFFIVQSFYKALLFFSAGGVMKATKEESLDDTRGLRQNTLLYVSTLFGILAAAGMIPFSGFFASAAIGASLESNLVVYALISAVGLGTSFFLFRWFLYVSGPDKSGTLLRYKAIPKTMVFTSVILAALTLGSSILIFRIANFLDSQGVPAYMLHSIQLSLPVLEIGIVTLLFALGTVAAYTIYKPSRLKAASKYRAGVLGAAAYTHPIFMASYKAAAWFMYEISEGVGAFDTYLSAGLDWIGHAIVLSSRGLRRISVGSINPYALVFAAGLVFLLAYAYLVLG